ncbi:CDP-glucose 4,6-dehydratase [Thiorhodococcus mannitoliphagus]|uniref:CDP-glucose 4,6-dehydratase n=1 Tax=Thiorhodococcus mannitoliphagus TaxID=329406 RepID=A0A6P1DYA0_9GAMM|nr:CDP-glucose 4,6-dehydratase [Thiorhodococcus mannitoliphagus]NEX21696.1 CDP-glucose 4,6-dehydratase [Thiorhodococcus mannitoliphagus]
MESLVVEPNFWRNKSVLLTGHTGFKGGWLALWLTEMGVKLSGYALAPPTDPSFFELARIKDRLVNHCVEDIRNLRSLSEAILLAQPEVVFHFAAQPLVRASYRSPVDTYSTNLMGTVNVLESVRQAQSVRAVVVVTTDKCYENREWDWPYRETDELGGADPYASSKAGAELIVSAYRRSYLARLNLHVASARAGNVLGGGDWAAERLIPDFFRSVDEDQTLHVRSLNAVRPWQHVLEPLHGYLMLAQALYKHGNAFAEAWNFGPNDSDMKSVRWIVDCLCALNPQGRWEAERPEPGQIRESKILRLDSSKARNRLGWRPQWDLMMALRYTAAWHEASKKSMDMQQVSLNHLSDYLKSLRNN